MWGWPLTVLLLLLNPVSSTFVGEKRTENGLHIPLHRKRTSSLERRDLVVGLGDYYDVSYNVLLKIGNAVIPLIIDTGSSDLWVVADTCQSEVCQPESSVSDARYQQASFQSSNLDVQLFYGDSFTGTYAFGLIGKDSVNLAGSGVQNQYFGAINNTNTSVLLAGSSGIFGLGFPINSAIWVELFQANYRVNNRRGLGDPIRPPHTYNRLDFPPIAKLTGLSSGHGLNTRQSSTTSEISTILSSWDPYGPFISRLISSQNLRPFITITLQRDTIDAGGNAGLMSIGELPPGVKNESLTWVPIRAYGPEQDGLAGPPDSTGERYPIAWEVPLDDVYLDGEKLPRSTLASSDISFSALLDTGNSLLRGPADTVQLIQQKLGGTRFSCGTPHTLTFEIGGKMFPVDPRDFITKDSVRQCGMNVVTTDTPKTGSGYLYSWSLGDPFLKSVLSSYYYGNLTYPSRDPPRLGLLSTVPSDANERYENAVEAAGDRFPAFAEPPPDSKPTVFNTDPNGVPLAQPTGRSKGSGGNKNGALPGPTTRVGLPSWLGSMFVATGTYLWG
ncbi:hypothetical protein V5O48_000748 [Marasmius crinis-equi]|uniref:Peptidase A1 domain-containing protein n=1 Tax=Marasmius crinis-equi TaxID=585013 RepID=A0ABR3G0E2_9AGAR